MNSKESRNRIALIIFGFMVIFSLCEAGLRVAGFIYYHSRIKEKAVDIKKQGNIKILCVGDSYTFGHGATAGYSYPEQLEGILNKDEAGAAAVI